MQEVEKRAGLTSDVARRVKLAVDERYARKKVVNRTVFVKVDNEDFSPNPEAFVDIKVKLIDDHTLLSVKCGSWHGDTVRHEYEVSFRPSDLGNLLTILKLFGHSRFIVLKTVRTIWTANGVIITLDEYHKIGKALFEVELEDFRTSTEAAIDRIFASLGLEAMDSEKQFPSSVA